MSGSGSGGGKGTTFPCDISDLCADQVAGQRLPQRLTTFRFSSKTAFLP